MNFLIGSAGYTVTGVGFCFLFLLILTTKQSSLQKKVLLLSSVFSFIWALSFAFQIYYQHTYSQYLASETLRNYGWYILILSALTEKKKLIAFFKASPTVLSLSAVLVLCAGIEFAYPWISWLQKSHLFIFHLTQSVVGLWLIEQLFRRIDNSSKWAIKPLCLGLGMAFAYDFALYADGVLTNSIDRGFWYARGWVTILTLPLVLITARRMSRWSTRVYVSRDVVYHSTLLMVAGGYLLVMALAGYYIRYAGGSWGSMVQNIFFALSGLILASLFLSEVLRRKLKVFITKHFYANKYEYREEWMRFASILEENMESTYQVALKAMIRPFNCEHGILITLENNKIKKQAYHNLNDNYLDSDETLKELAELAINQHWIVDIKQLSETGEGLPIKYELKNNPEMSTFGYVIPISGSNGIKSACFISEPKSTHALNWEDRDLMWAISKQLSVYLNLYHTNQTLTENQQFDTFNRMSAFLAHDLKNILAQLQLLSKNGKKHKDNPEFIEDAFETIDSATARLNKVVTHLRKKNIEANTEETFNVEQLINKICTTRAISSPAPLYRAKSDKVFSITCDKERFSNVLTHLIQNAQEATQDDGHVYVTTRSSDQYFTICIEDNGEGMTESFIEKRLFKPFDTTKGNSGMGIGAYDAKKMVEQLGGYIDVSSTPGQGACFTLYLPVHSQ